jgi:AcrR family transcriptional regulator
VTRPCRSEDAILQATFDLVAEHGVGGVTVDAVAARAGVGKQTIYRHWGSRAKLIHAAISCMALEDEVPDTGSLRGDLTAMLHQLAVFLGNSDAGRVLPSLFDAAERDPELRELRQVHIAQRRGTFEHVLRRGIERGELAPGTDLDLLTDVLVGPFFYKRIVSQREVVTLDVAKVLDLVLAGVGASVRADV